MSADNKPSDLTRGEATSIILEELANLTSKGYDAVFPERKHSDRIRIQPQQRIEKYQKIANLINSYDLPEDKVNEQLLVLGWGESITFLSNYLQDRFFCENGMSSFAGTFPPSRYDAFDELAQIFPQVTPLLKDFLGQRAHSIHFSDNADASNSYNVSFEELLVAEFIDIGSEPQKKLAEAVICNTIIMGKDFLGTLHSEVVIQTVDSLIKKYKFTQDEIHTVSQNAINSLAIKDKTNRIEYLANVTNIVSNYTDINSFDWSKFSMQKTIKSAKMELDNYLVGIIKPEYNMKIEVDVLDYSYIPEIKQISKLPFLNIKAIGTALIRNINMGDIHLKHDVITKIADACLTNEESRDVISKYILNHYWKHRFTIMSIEERKTLHKWAMEIGSSDLAAKIEKEGFKQDEINELRRKNMQPDKKELERIKRLEAAHKLLAKN